MPQHPSSVSRRRFLGRTLAAAAVVPLAPALAPVAAVAASSGDTASGAAYRSLTLAEAGFTESMVNALCPADALTPDGVTSGLAAFIDAHLSGAAPEAQRELFRHGVAAADAACLARRGASLAELSQADARLFIREMAAGEVLATLPLASWYADVVEPMLRQACFSGPIYEGLDGRMFWKLFG